MHRATSPAPSPPLRPSTAPAAPAPLPAWDVRLEALQAERARQDVLFAALEGALGELPPGTTIALDDAELDASAPAPAPSAAPPAALLGLRA